MAAGIQDADGDGDPNVQGTRSTGASLYLRGLAADEGSHVEPVGASARLLDAAVRVLADLSDDGKLSRAEGTPALAAILGALTPEGAISADLTVQSLGTWALAEAARAHPRDPWVRTAARKSLADLEARAPKGEPEERRFARLVLGFVKPGAELPDIGDAGAPSAAYVQLTGAAPSVADPTSPWSRLVRSLRSRSRLAFRPA